jgi:hypothetical protein
MHGTGRPEEEVLTHKRFMELLNGPLNHPIAPLMITRLTLALHAVVEATGKAGEDALEAHCRDRAADRFKAENA